MYTLKKCNIVKIVESEHERDKLLQKGFLVADIENATEKSTYVDATELVKRENEALKAENAALKQEIETLKAQTGGEENGESGESEQASADKKSEKAGKVEVAARAKK